MKNLFKVAALGLALTAGLSSCESKSTETTTIETPAATTETTTTTVVDSTNMAAPATEGAMAAPATEGATAPAATTTTVTEEVK